jgi:hypothetical protein
VSLKQHLVRITLLMTAALGLLTWLATHTEVMFADGLRYIALAQAIDQGSWKQALAHAVDHPAYPLAVAAVHRMLGGARPEDWQTAAQVAAIVAGVLLIIPLYLFVMELHGPAAAWLACVLSFLVPLTGHVLADVLSEGMFLVFWTLGCWTALRFLRQGRTVWLVPTIGLAGLAYLTRPEGMLLPVALVATLTGLLIIPSARLEWPRFYRAICVLVVGPVLVLGPYVAFKGGIGTKPAVARLLGLSARSPAMAVERERPLDPGQSVSTTLRLACKAVVRAVLGSVTAPLLLLAVFSLAAPSRYDDRGRGSLFLLILLSGWLLALLRLHATGGYCTPRHALIFALPVIAAAARGLTVLTDVLTAWFFAAGHTVRLKIARTSIVGACLAIGLVFWGPDLVAPINAGFQGYHAAGHWLNLNTPADARVLDLKGWATFYGQRGGYSFGDLGQARGDPHLGWLVAHDALLIGPWDYCEVLRQTVAGRHPIKSFPERRRPGVAQVHIFDLSQTLARSNESRIR